MIFVSCGLRQDPCDICRVFHTLDVFLMILLHVPLRSTWGYKYAVCSADLRIVNIAGPNLRSALSSICPMLDPCCENQGPSRLKLFSLLSQGR